ncbi:unnamed protein product [Eruca vesicaria subsp. sativa]|uniref:TIR domain-containing protein n=1 Tax=Eruca vesicaria subsp. sativa TaxID=29727 RepID=A0ABC8JBG1_ERUVS|nr:unnamed protein product [Eruca vesicaria subsp. sativa]
MKFEVFVSFREIDTRRTFVSHLLLSLFKNQIRTFKQEEEIPWNQPASSQVLEAIQDCKMAIVVISKNYTASVSCLDQLAKIVECKEKQTLVMIPVLYEVDPSHVLTQAENLWEHSGGEEKVMRWRDALNESIKIYLEKHAYWEDKDSYSYIIDRVMSHVLDRLRPQEMKKPEERKKEVYRKFKMSRFILLIPIGIVTMGVGLVKSALGIFMPGKEKPIVIKLRPTRSSVYVYKDEYVTDDELSQLVPSSDFSCLVGMDRQIKAVDALLLGLDSKQVGEIGIWGVEGVGKTTLARFVYQQISPQFQDHCYFEIDSQDNSVYPTCLLEEVTRSALTSGSERLYESVKAEFGHRKVLLVVDVLNRTGDLKNIRKITRWFGPESRLIVVTEQNDVLVQCEVRRVFEVEPLRYDEALQLFSQFAFKQEHVPREYHRLSVRAVLLTGRIPLALKVFGSFLRGKVINEWELELCRLEASQDSCVAKVSGYIGNGFS